MTIEEAIDSVKRVAKGAWHNLSFSPEKREASAVRDFENSLRDYASQVEKIAPDEVPDFIKRFTAKATDYIGAHHNLASPMITGPARFPTARMEKRWDSTMKKLDSYVNFPKWYIKTLKKRKERQWRKETGYDLPTAELDRQKKYLEQLKTAHEKMKLANKIIRSGKNVKERLSKINFEGSGIKSWWEKNLAQGKGFETWALSNNLANIKRVEGRVIELERKAAAIGREEPKLEFPGGYMIKNNEEDRLQFFFDGIPSQEIINALKKNGYRWSGKNKAWQRKLTTNALYSVGNLYEILNISKDSVKAYNAKNKELNQADNKKIESKPKPTPAKARVSDEVMQEVEQLRKERNQETPYIFDEKLNGLIQMNLGLSRKHAAELIRSKLPEVKNAYAEGVSASQVFANLFEKKPKPKQEPAPAFTVMVNEDKMRGKPSTDKDYIGWLASVTRLFEQALDMERNEVQKLLEKHDSLVSKAWAKGLDSLDAGRYLAEEMDKARAAEREATAKETRGILAQEAANRDKKAEKAGGFDFIHEVGYSGKTVIKTYLPLKENRGLKLNGLPDADGYRMYMATDKEFEKLKQDYPNNQYGMNQEYGSKHLNKYPKLVKAAKPTPAKKKTAKASDKHYLTSIQIEWAEAPLELNLDGKKYDSAAAFMADLIKVGVPGGNLYNKVKFKAKWDNGAEITERIDIGENDYNPLKQSISPYMEKKTGVMYASNRDANDVAAGKYLFRFKDEVDNSSAPKPKTKGFSNPFLEALGQAPEKTYKGYWEQKDGSIGVREFVDVELLEAFSVEKQESGAKLLKIETLDKSGKVIKVNQISHLSKPDNTKAKERAKAIAIAMKIKYKYSK